MVPLTVMFWIWVGVFAFAAVKGFPFTSETFSVPGPISFKVHLSPLRSVPETTAESNWRPSSASAEGRSDRD